VPQGAEKTKVGFEISDSKSQISNPLVFSAPCALHHITAVLRISYNFFDAPREGVSQLPDG
jgi:hypothetical protein